MSGIPGIPRWFAFLVGIPAAIRHPFKTLGILLRGRHAQIEREYACTVCGHAIRHASDAENRSVWTHCQTCGKAREFRRRESDTK